MKSESLMYFVLGAIIAVFGLGVVLPACQVKHCDNHLNQKIEVITND